jgi:hypothetical protein
LCIAIEVEEIPGVPGVAAIFVHPFKTISKNAICRELAFEPVNHCNFASVSERRISEVVKQSASSCNGGYRQCLRMIDFISFK